MKGVILVLAILLTLPSFAFGYCFAPDAPDPPFTSSKPTKPTAPYCVDTFTNTHTCDQWEVDSYNSALRQYKYDIEEYIRKLQEYVNEANDFANEALEYAKCEIRSI